MKLGEAPATRPNTPAISSCCRCQQCQSNGYEIIGQLGGEADGEIEGPSPANDIRADAPPGSTHGQTEILGEGQIDGPRWMQFVDDGRQDDGGDLRPQLMFAPRQSVKSDED